MLPNLSSKSVGFAAIFHLRNGLSNSIRQFVGSDVTWMVEALTHAQRMEAFKYLRSKLRKLLRLRVHIV